MARKATLLVAATILCWAAGLTDNCQAQDILAMPRVGGYSSGPDAPIGAGGVGRPAVSPYMNLQVADALGMAGAYQTLVQPFVFQRQVSNTQQASIQKLQQQVTTVETANSMNRRPGQIMRDTGHQTRNLNYSHYYPTTRLQ
jgi:hypothetical protein